MDANRNFDYEWEKGGTAECCATEGVSCANDYKGPSVWSESEVAAVRDFVLRRNDSIRLFLGLHAYGELILLPFGDTPEPSGDYEDQRALADNVRRHFPTSRRDF